MGVETNYDQRPEGYDRLGSYAGGSNKLNKRLIYHTPTIMRISGERCTTQKKTMTWPMICASPGSDPTTLHHDQLPEATIRDGSPNPVKRVTIPSRVVAVTTFDLPATEPIVRGYTGQLVKDVKRDGLVPAAAFDGYTHTHIHSYTHTLINTYTHKHIHS